MRAVDEVMYEDLIETANKKRIEDAAPMMLKALETCEVALSGAYAHTLHGVLLEIVRVAICRAKGYPEK